MRLRDAPGDRQTWGGSRARVYAWSVAELLFVTNPWQISSRLRVAVLRLFGAQIGPGVTFRPRTRVRFPWKLTIGADTWIGEGVWIHNQDQVKIEHDVVISQESFLTTGSHRHRSDMGLVTRPILIEAGTWVTSRCMILGGVTIGRSSLIEPMTVVQQNVPSNTVLGSDRSAYVTRPRFRQEQE
ncbi:acetyltransferase [Curtobacterium sp. BRD11]|uniref:acetyltransferase n=1 Tax=Curtobacterium sp. BRD11 TaxID=2962581 RepID=UPI002881C3B7|nr:acetyltransferase [Curtobacterium sp. BRD11]MDT0211472.1 acetyltransferase [Curtobacterium sp. BRD11]